MSIDTRQHVSRKLATSRGTMVAAKHPDAVRVGLDVMGAGGNAVDAAVAVGFAIGVLEPWMNGLAGAGFMTIQPAGEAPVVIDYFSRAPMAATPDMYSLSGTEQRTATGFGGVEDEANAYGPLSVAVPGFVAGMAMALERFGTRSLAEMIQPAIPFAEEGFEVDWYTALYLTSRTSTILRDAETASVFLPDGRPPVPTFPAASPRIRQVDLARTLRTIADSGPDGFYRGDVAERIVEHVQRLGGIITMDDMQRMTAVIVDPLMLRYHDHDLVLLPYQAGGITIGEALNILDGMDVAATGFNTAASLHGIAEASRRGFADRFAFVADPDFVSVDWERLASTEYAAERRDEIDRSHASYPGPGAGIATPTTPSAIAEGSDGDCTTHFSIVDRHGTMVSVTQTLTLGFGSAVTVPGTGVLLNDNMYLFDPVPGKANSIAPWKRPASSMAHAIAVKDGQPVLAVGAPGGRRIMDTCLQMVLDVIDYGMNIQSACGAALIDCAGPELLVDDRIPVGTRARLTAMGHNVVAAPVTFNPRIFASPTGVAVDPATGVRHGGADPFGKGIAAGR